MNTNQPLNDIEIRELYDDDTILKVAESIAEEYLHRGIEIKSAIQSADYLKRKLGHLQREEFVVLYLDSKHRLIKTVHEFIGTIDQTAVYPREIVKRALTLNASAIICAHNHPTGVLTPSSADHKITKALKSALELMDIRFLDHFIVSYTDSYSFAEHGYL